MLIGVSTGPILVDTEDLYLSVREGRLTKRSLFVSVRCPPVEGRCNCAKASLLKVGANLVSLPWS